MQETLYRGQWCLSSLPSRHSSPNHHQLHCRIFLNLFDDLKSLPCQRCDTSFGKSQKSQTTKSGLWQGWVTGVIWCFTKKLCTRYDAWLGALLWWSRQSSVAHSWNLLNHSNSFCRRIFKLNAKFDADFLLYSLSHFEWNGHTVHMLTQWCLPPPLTSTVKLSLFMHMHSSLLSLAARLHQSRANHSCYINNGWAFSGLFPLYVRAQMVELRGAGTLRKSSRIRWIWARRGVSQTKGASWKHL